MEFEKLPPVGIETKKFEEVTIGDMFVWVDEVESESIALRTDTDRYVYLESGYVVICPVDELAKKVHIVRGTLHWNFISERG